MGVVDLSSITDRLIGLLTDCRDNSSLWNPDNLPVNPGPPFTITPTGLSPESVRTLGDCQLTLYLFHVTEDKFQKNLDVPGQTSPTVPLIRYTPLSLDLYYLLTAFSKNNYVQEQQAMTVAMRCFHDNPIVKLNVIFGAQVVNEEFTLTMETENLDELSRLWQSFAVPPRFSAVYKASVVLVSPEAVLGPPAPKPTHITITADPSLLPFAAGGQVIGTARTFQFRKLDGTLSTPLDMAPATVAPNQLFFLYGAGLNQPTSNRVYLTMLGNVEVDVTSWLTGPPNVQTQNRFTLRLPNAFGAPPAASPPPGIYQLSVGNALTIRSNTTPFSIGPRIDVSLNPPILAPGPIFTVSGIGFVAGATQVLLDTVLLTEGAPGAGLFQVNGPGTQISFQAPAGLSPQRHAVRIRVNGVEADPSWWI
jgi:hypothetical protein